MASLSSCFEKLRKAAPHTTLSEADLLEASKGSSEIKAVELAIAQVNDQLHALRVELSEREGMDGQKYNLDPIELQLEAPAAPVEPLPPVEPKAPLAPEMTYEQFKAEMQRLLTAGMKYSDAKQAGDKVMTEKMADLAEKYPEFDKRLEDEPVDNPAPEGTIPEEKSNAGKSADIFGPAAPAAPAPKKIAGDSGADRGSAARTGSPQGRIPGEAPSGATGESVTVLFPPASKRPPLKARYSVVELDTLQPSHRFGSWQTSDAWTPEELAQQRDYAGGAMQAVRDGVRVEPLSVDHVLMHTGDIGNGPPIIDQNGIVLGGNNRSHRIAENYRKGDPAEYKAELESLAQDFGVDQQAVAGMKQPVLVRSVETSRSDNPALIAALNEMPMNALDAAAEGANRGLKVGANTMSALAGIGDATLGKYLDDNGAKVVNALVADGVFRDTDLPRLYNFKAGKWEKGGKDSVIRALFGGIVPDATILAEAPPAFVNKLVRALPELIRLKKHKSAVLDDLPEALKLASEFYAAKQGDPKLTIKAFGTGGQRDMFTGKVAEDKAGPAWELFQAIHGMNQIETKEHFRALADEAAGTTGSLFGNTPGFNEPKVGGGAPGAMSYRYQGPGPIAGENRAILTLIDLVDLVQKLNRTPDILRKIAIHRGQAAGVFRHRGDGTPFAEGHIELRADIATGPVIREGTVKASEADDIEKMVMGEILAAFPELTPDDIVVNRNRAKKPGQVTLTFLKKDPSFAPKVLAHEIGHLADWLDDKDMHRGNILGRIASLNNYLSHMIEQELPDGGDENWLATQVGREEWAEIRKEMYDEAKEYASSKVDKREDPEEWAAVRSMKYEELKKQYREDYGFITRQDVMEELKNLTRWWSPFDEAKADPQYLKYRFSGKELYAEALSVMMNAPAELQAKAPLFYQSFFSYMERKADVKAAYDAISAMIAAGGSVDNAGLKIQAGIHRGNETVLRSMDKEPLDHVAAIRELATMVVDRGWAIAKAARNWVRSGKALAPELNPELAYEAAKYSGSEEGAYIDDLRRRIGALVLATGIHRGVIGEILVHNRVIHERSNLFNPEGFTAKTSQERLDQLRERFGAKNVDAVLQFWKDNHAARVAWIISKPEIQEMFSEDLLKKMTENDAYAKFSVVDYLDAEHGAGSGAKIFKQVGTLKSVVDPVVATAMQDGSLIWSANMNHAKIVGIDFLSQFKGEVEPATQRWVNNHNEFEEPKDSSKALVLVMRKGKTEGYYLSKTMAAMYVNLSAEDMKHAAAMARVARSLFANLYVRLNMSFQMANPIRDLHRAIKHAPGTHNPLKGLHFIGMWAKAMKDTMGAAWTEKPNAEIEGMKRDRMLISEGSLMGLVDDWEITDKRLREMLGNEPLINTIAKKEARALAAGMLTRIREKIGKYMSAAEYAPKLAMLRWIDKTQPGMNPLEKAELVRRAGSPKFLLMGSESKILNASTIFLTPMVQSIREDVTLFRAKPGEQLIKTSLYTLLPALVMWALKNGMGGDDDDELEKMFKAVSERELFRNVVVPLYMDELGKPVRLTFPMDQNDALISGMFQIALDAMRGRDTGKSAPSRATRLMTDSLVPSVSPPVEIVWDLLQYAAGKNPNNSWTDRPMVPKSLFDANTLDTHAYFARQMWNKFGGGALGYFQSGNHEQAQTQLDAFLHLPLASSTLGRVLKTSDYGTVEAENEAKAIKERDAARERETRRQPDGTLLKKPRYSSNDDFFGPRRGRQSQPF